MKPLRRKKNALTNEHSLKILDDGFYGVLSTVSEDGEPYGVPLNYVRLGDKLYFHCALEGQKLDNIKFNPRASFLVVAFAKLLPEEFDTDYESVIAFGPVKTIEGDDAKTGALLSLCEKYTPGLMEAAAQATAKSLHRTAIMEMTIEHLQGKNS